MATDMVARRLSAILAADVVGYSRLIRADEEGTLAALKGIREDIIDPKIAEHHGRVVKLMGDGMLAEFGSVVDAVRNAVAMQQAVAEHQAEVPEDRRIVFRVGVNLGDVVIEGDDIHGDGVNVAARLEGLADPGGICVSGAVHEQVRDRIDLTFEDLGEQEVKNIDRPIRVWRWASDTSATASGPAPTTKPLPLPDKPSIAVLPFDNMSGDPEQEYFSDGITDDIIVELSRYRELFVIARNSTFAYKGAAANVKQVAAELGVRYVLEGGVRKAGTRVRITAELIEAASGHHLWAERYDRDLDDIFAVQDEVARVIVGALGAKLQETDIDRAERKDTDNQDAYDLVLRAIAANLRFTKADNADSRRLCLSAIDLDPGYVRAYARLAMTYTQDRFSGWADDTADWLKRAHVAARKAVSLDESDYYGHLSLGICDMVMGRHDQAVTELRRAVELNPNFADSHVQLGNVLTYAGRAEEAVAAIETAMRLNPLYPPYYLMILGRAHFVRRHYQEALPPLERAVIASPGLTQARAVLAACYAALGRDDDARAEIEEIRESNPDFTVNYVAKVISYKNPDDLDHHLDLLRRAGLPE